MLGIVAMPSFCPATGLSGSARSNRGFTSSAFGAGYNGGKTCFVNSCGNGATDN